MKSRQHPEIPERAVPTAGGMTRRAFVGGALFGSLPAAPAVIAALQASVPAADLWFWDLIAEVSANPRAGGPHSGAIIHSLYGVEAHRAGRHNPFGTPPLLSNFYLEAELMPETNGGTWEVGVAWRVSEHQDAIWWTITNSGTWSLYRGVWRLVLDERETLSSGEIAVIPESPLKLQALVAGPYFACSINEGKVVRTALPRRDGPGHVAIVANCSPDYLRPGGETRYAGLAVWSLDGAREL